MSTITTELMTRKAVALALGASPITVIRWEVAGKLKPIKLGAGSIRHRRTDVEDFIAASITPKAAQ